MKIDFFDTPMLIKLGPRITISWSFISQDCGEWKAPWNNNEKRKGGLYFENDS